jgi:hypothetical protein
MIYKIYKNSINQKTSDSLFKYILRVCNFYSPKIFKKEKYPKKWIDLKFISKLNLLRKNKNFFSSIYNTIQISNELQKIPFENQLDKIASSYLKIDKKKLSIRDIQFRMDFSNDIRNSYGWHQDSAYDKFNLNSKNGVVLWIPLVDTNKENGTLMIKPGSENSDFNRSKKIPKIDKFSSEQILVMPKYLKKYKSVHVNVKKNNCLATYSGIFHRSGINSSDHIRFTIIVRYNNEFSKDFIFYRKLKKNKFNFK